MGNYDSLGGDTETLYWSPTDVTDPVKPEGDIGVKHLSQGAILDRNLWGSFVKMFVVITK